MGYSWHEKKLQSELQDGETIEWIDTQFEYVDGNSFIGPFVLGVVFVSTSMYAIIEFISLRVYWYILFVFPNFVIGSFFIWLPCNAYWQQSITMYVITNKRVISMGGCRRSMSIKSYYADKLEDIHWKDNGDGFGDVVFAKELQNDNNENERTIDVGFFKIRNAEEVEGMIKKLFSSTLDGLELPTTTTTDIENSSTTSSSTVKEIVLPATTDVDENDIIVSSTLGGLELPTTTTTDIENSSITSSSTVKEIVLPATTDVDENDIIVSQTIP
jgi:hypothetical protein